MAEETFIPPVTNKPSGITPQQPSEPPKEVLSQTFSADDNMFETDDSRVTVEKADGTVVPLVKEETVQPIEKKEVEKTVSPVLKAPKEVKKEIVKEEKKEVVKQFTPPSKEKVQRDYSSYSSEEVAYLKQMSDTAYKFTTDLIKKTKEAEKSKSDTFLQHPEAFMLSPDYKQIQQDSWFAKREGDFWQQTLQKIKAGQSFKPLVGWNKDGTPSLGEEMQPNDVLEEQVRSNMNKCYGVAQESTGKLQKNKETFNSRIQEDLKAINAERQQRFAWVADPKLLDYTVEIEGVGERSIRQVREDIISLFPPYHRSSPAVEVAADLFVALRIQHAELQEAKANQQTAETKQKELQRAEPSSIVKPSAKVSDVNGVSEFTLAGMPD